MAYSPNISVITIVKNNEELLPRAIDSVLGQNFTDFEFLIINDGSTDNSKAIIDEYSEKDQRLKPKHMPQNVGRAKARNTGIDAANGKYILFLDSDDYLPETALKDLFEVAEQGNVDIVFGRIKSFDQQTGEIKEHHYTDNLINKELHKFRLSDHLELVKNHSIIGRLYRMEMLQKNNIRFNSLRKNGEDVTFSFYTVFYAESMSMMPEKHTYFYNIGNFLSTANESKLFDARDNILETLQFSMKKGSLELIMAMQKKVASFAGDLRRAQQVYGLGDELRGYLETLVPLVKDIPDEIINSLPDYNRNFTLALLAGDFGKALTLYLEKYNKVVTAPAPVPMNEGLEREVCRIISDMEENISKLNASNRKLSNHLNNLYNTRSWRLTVPLRLIFWRVKTLLR